ncbi:MAG TPA: DUF6364 family protein [Bryobacteraceae bacterium]|nr:DUF6364 family protein [Bryobacteraceae bacterium]
MAKLTLSVDDAVIARAKRYAERRHVSVSRLVEDYLVAVTEPPSSGRTKTPVLNALRGILKSGSREDYRRHLAKKYL